MSRVQDKIENLDCPWQDEEVLRELYEEAGMTQKQIAEFLGCGKTTISKWMNRFDISTGYKEPIYSYTRVALFSGGHDSLVSTHYVMEELDGEAVVHIDTGTGIDENRQFVEDVCEQYGWELIVLEPETSLLDFAKRWGFPKAGGHSWIYRYLKHHPLGKFATKCEGKPHFFTGVRKSESRRRMRTVTGEKTDNGAWVWRSPIADWTEEDCEAYIDANDLPRNPVVEVIGRSGECFCGAFADRTEELLLLREHYPEQFDFIRRIEKAAQEEIGTGEDYCWWGNTNACVGDDKPNIEVGGMKLCEDCAIDGKT